MKTQSVGTFGVIKDGTVTFVGNKKDMWKFVKKNGGTGYAGAYGWTVGKKPKQY